MCELVNKVNDKTIRELQETMRPWYDYNFPNTETWEPILGALEELGELAHAHLKGNQGIRHTSDEIAAKKKDAIGDVIVFLIHYSILNGWELQDLLETVVAEVVKRDWVASRAEAARLEQTTSLKQHYLETWRLILQQGASWSPEEVENWLQTINLAKLLDDPKSMIYHEAPQYNLVDALIPTTILHLIRHPIQKNYLRRDIKYLLADYEFDQNTDWDKFRKRLAYTLGIHCIRA